MSNLDQSNNNVGASKYKWTKPDYSQTIIGVMLNDEFFEIKPFKIKPGETLRFSLIENDESKGNEVKVKKGKTYKSTPLDQSNELDVDKWLNENLTGDKPYEDEFAGKFWTSCVPAEHMDVEGFRAALHSLINQAVVRELEKVDYRNMKWGATGSIDPHQYVKDRLVALNNPREGEHDD